MSKVIVICPGNVVTGGPELLHQLVCELTNNGVDAAVLYAPFDIAFKTPNEYQKYNVKVVKYNELDIGDGDKIVIPETLTGYYKCFKDLDTYIWWLSVDNYLVASDFTVKKLFKETIKRIIGWKGTKPKLIKVDFLRECKHLTQSEYAKLFLNKYKISSLMLSDYLNAEHLNMKVDVSNKEDIVCFNPKKGSEYTSLIRSSLPNVKFIPIQGMTAIEVSNLLSKSKVYIDFGEHPGKDRIPREAAMAKCIVITGLQGSANNNIDIPIPSKYKINEKNHDFIVNVSSVIENVFVSYEEALKDFEPYRDKIINEEKIFQDEVRKIFINSPS